MELMAPGVCSFSVSGVMVWEQGSEMIINSYFPQPCSSFRYPGVFIPNPISHCCRKAQADQLPKLLLLVLVLQLKVSKFHLAPRITAAIATHLQ